MAWIGRHLPVDLLEERNELLAPAALGVAADDRSVQGVQRGEQGRGSVPLVVVRHRRGPLLLHRQTLLRPPHCLNLRLLVDRQHHHPVRRIHVQPCRVVGFVFKLQIGRNLERLHQMLRDLVADKDAVRRRPPEADRLRQCANRPVRLPVRRRTLRQRQKFTDLLLGRRRVSRLARLVAKKTLHALLHVPPLPAPDRRLRRAGRGPRPPSFPSHRPSAG